MNTTLPALLRGSRRAPLLRLLAVGLLRGAGAFALVLLLAAPLPDARLLPAGLLLGALLLGLLRAAETLEAERLGQAYVRALRRRLVETLLARGSEGLAGHSRGSLWLRLTGDLNGLRRWISLGLARAVGALATLGVLLACLPWLSPGLALLVAAAVLVCAGFAGVRTRALERRETRLRRDRARLAGPVERLLRSLDGAAPPDPDAARRLRRRARAVAEASVDRARLHAQGRGLAEAAPLAVLAGAGLLLAAPGTDPAALAPALALSGLLAAPLRDLVLAWELHQGYRVARRNVLKLLHPVAEPPAIIPALPASPAGLPSPL